MRKLNLLYLCMTIILAANAASAHSLIIGNFNFDVTAPFFSSWSYYADVHRVNLSQDIIFAGCSNSARRCSENKTAIDIFTEASHPQNDVFTYIYKVSGGKITGEGEKVVWDLSGVKPGEYIITAGADASAGVGITQTRRVFVVECPESFAENAFPENLSEFQLSRTQVYASCAKGKICRGENHLIKISVALANPTNAKTVFRYEVSGGRIIGNGNEVEWDLSEAAPGNYTVTAGADVGRGICGNQIGQTIPATICSRCKNP